MFRLLGIHPGPDISVHATASLARIQLRQAREALDELARSHLLSQHAPGRFAFHDLLRAYAAEKAQACESEAELRSARHRMLDHYLHTGHAAILLLNPIRTALPLPEPQAVVAPEPITDGQQALAWFEAEHEVLLAVITQAGDTGFHTHAWQLPWTLTDFLDLRGHWHEWISLQQGALASARRLGDQDAQARIHHNLGRGHSLLGSYQDAQAHVQHSLNLNQQLGDRLGEAFDRLGLARILGRQGRYGEATGHAEQALGLFRNLGHRAGQADALMTIGWFHAHRGNSSRALTYGEHVIAVHRDMGDRRREGMTWDWLGYAHHNLGQHKQAIDCYQQAIDLLCELGDRYNQAEALTHLGDTHHAAGDPAAARDAWRQALAILDDLHHPQADNVRARLRGHAPRSTQLCGPSVVTTTGAGDADPSFPQSATSTESPAIRPAKAWKRSATCSNCSTGRG